MERPAPRPSSQAQASITKVQEPLLNTQILRCADTRLKHIQGVSIYIYINICIYVYKYICICVYIRTLFINVAPGSVISERGRGPVTEEKTHMFQESEFTTMNVYQ